MKYKPRAEAEHHFVSIFTRHYGGTGKLEIMKRNRSIITACGSWHSMNFFACPLFRNCLLDLFLPAADERDRYFSIPYFSQTTPRIL
jgi:hypothetical protein